MFSSVIFEDMHEQGSPITSTTGTMILGLGNLLGGILAPINVRFLTRRQIFIGGQLASGSCMFFVALF